MERSLTGGPELLAALQALPEKIALNIARGGARAGARVIAKRAQGKVRRKTGTVAKSIRVSSRGAQSGFVSAKVVTRDTKAGDRGFVAIFLERGTAAHLISVREANRPRAKGKPISIRTLNRNAKETGSLEIGGKFVGVSVIHSGSRPFPFMMPALVEGADEAITACGDYIRSRLTKEGLDAPWAGLADDVDEDA